MESFDLTEPSLLFCFGDSGDQVVADLDEAVSLIRVRSEHEASNTRVFVDAGRSECASADSDGEFASLEVPEEGIPFFVGEGSVLLAGPECSAPGNECVMGFDGLAGVDG